MVPGVDVTAGNGHGPRVRVAIVGSGFSGLGMAIELKRRGMDDFVVLERSDDVGGTWRDNTYPGCQCDVPSHLYSFSFAPNPYWSRTYSTQPEIQAYLRRCARTYGVLPHVRFRHEVTRASWDEDGRCWRLDTSRGVLTADVLVAAHGALAEPAIPPMPGLERFGGTTFHSAGWNHDSELRGKRVAVIGTGASAIQIVPRIRPEVERLHVFQRTPAWVLPHTDRPVTRTEQRLYLTFPLLQKLVRAAIYCSRELLVLGLAKDPRLVAPLRSLATAHLRRQVRDPELRRKLMPRFSPGCKRLLLSNDFYPALQEANVELVTEPILELREEGIATGDGRVRDVDTLVFGTGFRVTDNPVAHRLVGRGGRSLSEAWGADGMRAYLGTTIPGFPNFFLMTGPNTGIGHTSLLVMIEAQVHYILECLRFMRQRAVAEVEVRSEAVAEYNREIEAKLERTVWNAGGCRSWYLDPTGRNPTIWPDFTWRFRARTREFDPGAYHVQRAPRMDPVTVAARG